MNGALTWKVHEKHFTGVRFKGLFEIKGINLTCLIAVLWSHDWVQPMSCSQMGLIWVLAHAGIYNCHREGCRWDVFLLSVQFSWNINLWNQYYVGTFDIGIHIGQFMTCLFINLVPRWKTKLEPGAPSSV